MRDYKNLAWQNQQPWERNPNPPRSMRDYRDHWMSAPSYMVPPQYTSTPQPPQPPQLISPVEQAILDLTKLVGDVVEEQKKINAQLSQKIDTMENNVNKRIDGLQSEMEQKLDNLHHSISKLANHLVHQEEEYLEGEWLTNQEDLLQELVEAPEELPTGEAGGGRGKEAGEEPQEPILQPIPMKLNPSATASVHTASVHTATTCSKIQAYNTCSQNSWQSITACAILQEVSGHCTILCHYIKNNGSCSYRMAQRLVWMPVRVWST